MTTKAPQNITKIITALSDFSRVERAKALVFDGCLLGVGFILGLIF